MTGYREHSFDPNAYEQPGRPMRPFNWVQWCGVALFAVGMTLYGLLFAGRFGWTAPIVTTSSVGFVPMILGIALINSRREPGTQVGSEQLAKNRRVLLITIAACAAILGAALVIEILGAN